MSGVRELARYNRFTRITNVLLITLVFTGLVLAQQKNLVSGRSLRELVRESGQDITVGIGAEGSRPPQNLSTLVGQSDLILRGIITEERGRLSQDETEVWSDYVFQVIETIRGRGTGGTIRITRLGGVAFLEGRMVTYLVEGYPFFHPKEEYIFFLRKLPDSDFYTPLRGEHGCFLLRDGRVHPVAFPRHPVPRQFGGRAPQEFVRAIARTGLLR